VLVERGFFLGIFSKVGVFCSFIEWSLSVPLEA
jgi:hypothetical protein